MQIYVLRHKNKRKINENREKGNKETDRMDLAKNDLFFPPGRYNYT